MGTYTAAFIVTSGDVTAQEAQNHTKFPWIMAYIFIDPVAKGSLLIYFFF